MKRKISIMINRILLATALVSLLGCSDVLDPQLGGDKNELQPPDTEILNVPAPNNPDSVLYLTVQTISWRGMAPNNIVKGFHYKIITEFVNSQETLEQDWQFTPDEQKLIVFPPKDRVNKQTIIVKAEDRENRIDPTPDTLTIYTRQSINPET